MSITLPSIFFFQFYIACPIQQDSGSVSKQNGLGDWFLYKEIYRPQHALAFIGLSVLEDGMFVFPVKQIYVSTTGYAYPSRPFLMDNIRTTWIT